MAALLFPPSPRVVSIAVQPPPGRSASEFLPLIVQPVGQAPQRELIRRSILALYATGEFSDIEAVAEPATGGVRLRFETQPNFFLSVIRVLHSPDPPTATELEDASGLVIGEAYTPAKLAAAKSKLRQRLETYGYYQSDIVAATAIMPGTNQATVSFDIHAGALARLGEVSFTGTKLFSDAALYRASKLRSGEPMSRERIEDAAAALQAYYAGQGRLTANITLAAPSFHPAGNLVDLHFDVVAGPVVTIAAEGYPYSAGTLHQLLPMYQERAADTALVEEGRGNLVNDLQNKGYFDATVSYSRTQINADHLRILYTIVPGAKQSLDAVLFSGNHYFDADDLAERIAVRANSPWPDFIPGARGRFSHALAQGDAEAIAQLYRSNGFAAVAVKPVINRAYRGMANHVAVEFQIDEGPQTRVHDVRLDGASAVHSAALRQLLTTAPGQPFAESSVAADRNAILTYYYNAGYQSAICTARSNPAAAADQRDVIFTISEGAQETIHQVFIGGNHFVHRNVIAHDLSFGAGQPLSQMQLLDSQRQLYDSGLFTSAAIAPANPDGAILNRDVYVTVNEARRYTFSEGIGLQVQGGTGGEASLRDVLGETGYSPLLSFDVTRTAVTGRDQTLSLKSTYGTLQKRAVLGYDMPDFLDRSWLRADLTTFYDDTFDIRTFRAIREQAGVQFEQSLGIGAGMTYTLEYHRVRVLSPLVAPQEIPILSQPVQVAELAATYHRDHRDDPLDTHQGTYNSLQFGVDQSYGSGFADFGRTVFQNRWYHPLGKEGTVVLARSTQVGFELPFGQRSAVTFTNPITGAASTMQAFVLPLPERFLGGGADSLRGFSINQAGPRDPVTGFPVGGEALLVNNLELRFPLIGPSIGGVVFYDLGNVYSTPRQLFRSLLRWRPPISPSGSLTATGPADTDFTSHTLGLGIRYKTPVGPVRFDAGYMVNPPTFQYFSTASAPAVLFQRLPPFHFFFSIGQTF